MAHPLQHKQSSGVSPQWANLPRRKCDNCGKSYKPSRPLRVDQNYGFCCKDCNKQFYKHGAAFIQLKQAMNFELGKVEKRLREIVREELQRVMEETGAPLLISRASH